jgi:hypothetical protein
LGSVFLTRRGWYGRTFGKQANTDFHKAPVSGEIEDIYTPFGMLSSFASMSVKLRKGQPFAFGRDLLTVTAKRNGGQKSVSSRGWNMTIQITEQSR